MGRVRKTPPDTRERFATCRALFLTITNAQRKSNKSQDFLLIFGQWHTSVLTVVDMIFVRKWDAYTTTALYQLRPQQSSGDSDRTAISIALRFQI